MARVRLFSVKVPNVVACYRFSTWSSDDWLLLKLPSYLLCQCVTISGLKTVDKSKPRTHFHHIDTTSTTHHIDTRSTENMSHESYHDSGASDLSDTAREAKANERVKLVPVSVMQRGSRIANNSGSAKLGPFFSSQWVDDSQSSATRKPGEGSSNGSSDAKKLSGNGNTDSDARNLFGKSNVRKRRREDSVNAMDSDADEGNREDMPLDSDDDGIPRDPGTHYWPLREDGTEMKAEEYFDLKRRGFKFDYEPAAYRWDDEEAPNDREVLEEPHIADDGEQADLSRGTLPSSVMNFEDEGYDFEHPLNSPFYSQSGGVDDPTVD